MSLYQDNMSKWFQFCFIVQNDFQLRLRIWWTSWNSCGDFFPCELELALRAILQHDLHQNSRAPGHGRLNHVVLCLVWSFLPKPGGQNHTLRRSGLFSPVAGQKRKYWCFSSNWIYHIDHYNFSNLVCPSTRILSPESEQKVFIDKHNVKS